MTPEQKLKHAILMTLGDTRVTRAMSAEDVDQLYDSGNDEIDSDDLHEARSAFRHGEVETGLPTGQSSRHYESKSVAAKMLDGSWVGWSFWYGGGKHGEPESVDWVEYAYGLTCAEEEKLVVVRTFTKETP